MTRIVVASMRVSAGKTSLVVGVGKALGGRICYMKPFGDRLIYRKKRLWDHDSSLINDLFDLQTEPDTMSMGFDHSKMRFMFTRDDVRTKLREMADSFHASGNTLFVEGGRDLAYGTSVHLDVLSMIEYLDASLVLVLSGNDDKVMDDIAFMKQHFDLERLNLRGVVINKVRSMDDFSSVHLKTVEEMGIPVLGIIPHVQELTQFPLQLVNDVLFAKVITGEKFLNRTVKGIFIGAMSTTEALKQRSFKESDNLLITSGDRSDMVLAAIQTNSAGIVLTNNIIPPPNLVALSAEKEVPLLSVSMDTHQTARMINQMEPLLTPGDMSKIDRLESLVKEHLDMDKLLGKK